MKNAKHIERTPEQRQEIEEVSRDWTRINYLDEQLGLSGSDSLEDEYTNRLRKWAEEGLAHGGLGAAIIKKGELLLKIDKRENTDCPTQLDIDSRDAAIQKYNNEIEQIRRSLDDNPQKLDDKQHETIETELRSEVLIFMQKQYDNGEKVNRKKACELFIYSDKLEHKRLRTRAKISSWKHKKDTLYKKTHNLKVKKT